LDDKPEALEISDDFVWLPMLMRLGSKRLTPSNFLNINCPMCVSRNESADRKRRCGIKHDLSGIGIHCFNCGFRTRYRVGLPLPKQVRAFLEAVGIPSQDVKRMAYHAFRLQKYVQSLGDNAVLPAGVAATLPLMHGFSTFHRLPEDARTLSEWSEIVPDDPDFIAVCKYLFSRGDIVADAMEYYWSPSEELRHRLIVPFHFGQDIVGWTARAVLPDVDPRYLNRSPKDFLFNIAALENPDRKVVVLVEGVFDAIALDCVGLLGAKINERQAAMINQYDKQVIVVADRDQAGDRLVKLAMQYEWRVAFPKFGGRERWEADIKDVDDAVRRYGRLWTLHSVIASAEKASSQIEIKVKLSH